MLRAFRLDELLELADIHISLEPLAGIDVLTLRRQQIHSLRAGIFDIGAGRIEMAVVGDDVAGLQAGGRENAFGRPALMDRKNMLEAGDLAHRVFETMPRCASRIAFISEHQCGPLAGRHRARAAIGQKIDCDIVRIEQENIVVGGCQTCFPVVRAW